MRPRRQRSAKETQRVVNSLPFVEQLARRVAATMPHSIDIGDLVQDGVIGLIDRVEALGGRVRIASPPGGGTALHVAIPTSA